MTSSVIKLKEFGEDRFVSILQNLKETNLDRNRSWWEPLLRQYFDTRRYLEWFFVIEESGELQGFSTIQQFYPKAFRVLTRCFIYPQYRRPVLPKYDTFMSPASYMINSQLMYLQDEYETAFISLEGIKRNRTIINMAKKMEINTGLQWSVGEYMYQTCANSESSSCWQNICYTGKEPSLAKMSRDDWIEKYGKLSY